MCIYIYHSTVYKKYIKSIISNNSQRLNVQNKNPPSPKPTFSVVNDSRPWYPGFKAIRTQELVEDNPIVSWNCRDFSGPGTKKIRNTCFSNTWRWLLCRYKFDWSKTCKRLVPKKTVDLEVTSSSSSSSSSSSWECNSPLRRTMASILAGYAGAS